MEGTLNVRGWLKFADNLDGIQIQVFRSDCIKPYAKVEEVILPEATTL
jgi:hypothetical protein